MVARCSRAVRKRRKMKSARRIGGGSSAGGVRNASSRLRAGLPEDIFVRLLCPAKCLPARLSAPRHLRLRRAVTIPLLWKPEQLPFRHLDESEHLAAFRDERLIAGSPDLKGTPKADALQSVEPAFD